MSEVRYSTGFEYAHQIERARENLLECPIYRDGELVVPTDGTCTVLASDGTVAASGTISVVNDVATYTVPVMSAYDYSKLWAVEWDLDMPDGTTRKFRNGAVLLRSIWYPDVSDRDLIRRVSGLDPTPAPGIQPLTRETTFQPKIDEASTVLQKMLLEEDRRPWYIIEAAKLREPLVLLTLALIFEDIATRRPELSATAANYRTQFKDAMSRVRFPEDTTQTGIASGARGVRNGAWFAGGRM